MASQGAKQDKTMSSRLLTMKFMQRAAASGPKSAPSTPESRPSKRPRLSEPVKRASGQTSELERMQEALAAEELKRQQALDRQAADAGDSLWELDLPSQPAAGALNVVHAGYTFIDSLDANGPRVSEGANGASSSQEEEDDAVTLQTSGRRSFGRFNKTLEKQQRPDGHRESSSSSDSEADESESDDDSDGKDEQNAASRNSKSTVGSKRKYSVAAEEIREKRKARRKAEKQDQAQQAERRRNKQVKLNGLTSLSGRGGGERPKGPAKCFTCGGTGHKKDQCPKRGLGL